MCLQARLARFIEMAVAGSHTPAVMGYASRKVGWTEDAVTGALAYDPMASCDHSLFTKQIIDGAPGSSSDPSQPLTSTQNADSFLLGNSDGTTPMEAEYARSAFAAMFFKNGLSTSGAAPDTDDDEDDEPGISTSKRRKMVRGMVATRTIFAEATVEADRKKEEDALKKKFAEDVEYERIRSAFAEWTDLKAKYPFLVSRVLPDGSALAAAALVSQLSAPQLRVCVEGATSTKAKAGTKLVHAMQFVAAVQDTELQAPHIPSGYPGRLPVRRERAAAAASATASSVTAGAPAAAPAEGPAAAPAAADAPSAD
jgi:hypothetical protein